MLAAGLLLLLPLLQCMANASMAEPLNDTARLVRLLVLLPRRLRLQCQRRRMRWARAASYSRLHLLDLALTSWSSMWAEAQELRQRASFFLAGRQAEQRLALMQAWATEAARRKRKRERLEM